MVHLGLELPKLEGAATTRPEDALKEAIAAGMPVIEGRPDDPMLAFLDLPDTTKAVP